MREREGIALVTFVDAATWEWGPSVVCLGYFDGVHAGHQALLALGAEIAARQSLLSCAHTYDLPPISLLKPQHACLELTAFEEKCELLERYGAQVVAVSRFDERLLRLPGEVFVDEVLIGRMQARHLVVGFDHRFGYQGDTDVDKLARLCAQKGLALSVVPPVRTADGRTVSSSAIRAALKAGHWGIAEEMLGRPVTERMRSLCGRQEGKQTL